MSMQVISYPHSGKFFTKLQAKALAVKWLWGIWMVVMLVSFLVQLLTIDVLPHIQQDEAQITDYGRLALHPQSDWAVTWRVAEGKPLLLWSYVGPLIAEASFHLFGPSGLGPRIASLIGGLLAATMALGWILARKVPVYAAFGLSLAFLLDPLFLLSQRMARVDSWVVALCLAACWILHSELKKDRNTAFRWQIMVAGGLAAMAALVWPSAVFLYPLILLELIQLPKSENAGPGNWRSILINGVVFASGALIGIGVLILPVLQSIVIIYNDMTTMFSQNIDVTKTIQERFSGVFQYQSWVKMIKAFVKTFSPILPILALFGAIAYRKHGAVVVVCLTAIAIIFSTLIYEFRVLYLMPYLLVLSSGLFIRLADKPSSLLFQRASKGALILLIFWSVGTSLFLRTILGTEGKTVRDREKIYEVANTGIGPGNYNVYLGFTYEFYFVGRSLGWNLYTPYIQYSFDNQGNWIREVNHVPDSKVIELLNHMDYAIFPRGSIDAKLAYQLEEAGLRYKRALHLGDDQPVRQRFTTENRDRDVLLWFLQGKESYGSYLLYSRDTPFAKTAAFKLN
ncbi:glycosyltransferase family 39 protein [Pontibacter chinhatensis]|uniref:4-amino-4-deoxy-L-arabinose transferase n=1 Tax=Pontibacter chinhatensis TaxID=1436961 RepID=A0A1I2WY16_9BACT|nr:glycosyltransferase family 39 protein [Pontibacter chinhatensis]SFH06165.1 4-amino-4-deoxy-L-arabinose transferase [Pontibacter chinhatensis]